MLLVAGNIQLQKLVLQFMVNMAASSQACLQHIWDECFPGRLAAVATSLSGKTALLQHTLLHLGISSCQLAVPTLRHLASRRLSVMSTEHQANDFESYVISIA